MRADKIRMARPRQTGCPKAAKKLNLPHTITTCWKIVVVEPYKCYEHIMYLRINKRMYIYIYIYYCTYLYSSQFSASRHRACYMFWFCLNSLMCLFFFLLRCDCPCPCGMGILSPKKEQRIVTPGPKATIIIGMAMGVHADADTLACADNVIPYHSTQQSRSDA